MPNFSRRQWLKIGVAVGGFAAFGVSYRDVAKRAVDGLVNGTSGRVTRDRIHGNSLQPEGVADNGWQPDPNQAVSIAVFRLLDTLRNTGESRQEDKQGASYRR